MSCYKFNLVWTLSFILSSFAYAVDGRKSVEKFTAQECLMATYDVSVKREGGSFWGLVKNELSVSKDVCELTIVASGVLDEQWKVDVCREPIHIKSTKRGSMSVYKRKGECKRQNGDYCDSLKSLLKTLEDEGLIFASGERELLSTDHGKIYCSYLLLKNHLQKGVMFSKYAAPADIYQASIGIERPAEESVLSLKERFIGAKADKTKKSENGDSEEKDFSSEDKPARSQQAPRAEGRF